MGDEYDVKQAGPELEWSIWEIATDLCIGKDISEQDFELLKNNIDLALASQIIVRHYVNVVIDWITDWQVTNPESFPPNSRETFVSVIACKLCDLPLYLNTPFKEILSWRLKHGM